MASTVLIIAVFVFTITHSSCENVDYNKYVPLVSDIRSKYTASTVVFLLSPGNSLMQEQTMAQSLARALSKRGIFTLRTDYENLNHLLDYYRPRIVRPLVLVFLEPFDNVTTFNESISQTHKSYPIWLMIFHGHSGDAFCEKCRRPTGNMFGLRFDTLMFVLCCGDPMLQEWWSVDGNSTETSDFGTWTANERLKLSTDHEFNARRRDVQGTGLRVVVVKNSTLVTVDDNGVGGFLGNVMRVLQQAMNFTITELHIVEKFGVENSTTKSWSGAIGMLRRGEADIAISDFGVLESRIGAIDFTEPLYLTKTKLFIKEPANIGLQWSAYFKAFESDIWVTLIVLLIFMPLLLTFMSIKQGSGSLGSRYCDCYLSVWGIFCQQGLDEFPAESSMRIAYFSIFILALVVSAAYSAKLISFITVTTWTLPFADLAAFVRDGSWKLIIYQNSSDYDTFTGTYDPVIQKMAALMKPWRQLPPEAQSAWKQVCSERVGLFTSEMQRRTTNPGCNLVGIESGRIVSFAMTLPRGSQYTNVVNYYISRLRASGIIGRLQRMHFNRKTPAEKTYDVVEFSRVVPILSILGLGIVLAIIVLFVELLYFFYADCKRRRLRKRKLPVVRRWESFKTRKRVELRTKNRRFHARGGVGGRRSTIMWKK